MSEIVSVRETVPASQPKLGGQDPATISRHRAQLTPSEWEEYRRRVEEACGKFAWTRTSSEEFSLRKQEEIDREEQKLTRAGRDDSE